MGAIKAHFHDEICAQADIAEFGLQYAVQRLIADAGQSRRDLIMVRILERVEVKDCGYKTPCWLWTGPDSGDDSRRGGGYPRFSVDDHTCAVHRVLWMHFHGFLPSKRQLDHLCEVRLCVNPDHFEKGTQSGHSKRDGRVANFHKG